MAKRNFSVAIPNNPDRLIVLAGLILQKHQQDGTTSKIPALLFEPLQTQLQLARTENARRNELDRQKEKCNEDRNLILGLHPTQNTYTEGTVRYFVTGARDVLLGIYRGNERRLGDWGFTVNSPKGSVQVLIPTKADQLITLAKLIQQKHVQDGSDSPLHNLDWNTLSMRLAEAEQRYEEGSKLSREKENATQVRNLALGTDRSQNSKTTGTVKYLVRAVRDVLLGIYRGKEQELGNWGFEVNRSTSGEAVENEAEG